MYNNKKYNLFDDLNSGCGKSVPWGKGFNLSGFSSTSNIY